MKSIALTEYLAKLLLVPARSDARRIIVPFAGVASEVIGAMRAGWEHVDGVEMSAEYVEIGRARIARWREVPAGMSVEDVRASAEAADPRQVSLFGGGR